MQIKRVDRDLREGNVQMKRWIHERGLLWFVLFNDTWSQ